MRALYITIPFLAAFLCACEVEPFSFKVGEELVVTTTKVTIVDTLSVHFSTYKKDSIVTSNTETILAGIVQDEIFGNISLQSYFQIGLPDQSYADISEICDSVSLILPYNDYYRGDTLQEQVYYLYELTEELEEDEDGGIYHSTSFSHSIDPVGTIRFDPRPLKEEKLEIPLSKSLGEDILAYLQENGSSLSEDDFLDTFKGFVLVPAENESHSVLGFGATDSTVSLKLYTHEPGPQNPQNEHFLPMTNSELQYNQITYDLNSFPAFDSITEKIGIPASYTDDIAHISEALGLYTKVTFPYLKNLTGEAELKNSILVSAFLYMEPVNLDYDSVKVLGDLRIYETEKNGDMGSVLINESSAELTAYSHLDPIYNESNYVLFDITDYVNYEIADYYMEPEFGFYLDLSSSGAAGTLEKLMLDGSQTAGNNTRIELTFFYYDL